MRANNVNEVNEIEGEDSNKHRYLVVVKTEYHQTANYSFQNTYHRSHNIEF
jgi:hypothetical protein